MHTNETTTVFLTICARNYLSLAFTLGQSVKQHHPDAEFVIWLLDHGPVETVPDGIKIRFIKDAIPSEKLIQLSLLYNVRELATAVKPRCMAVHIEEGVSRVIYLDPDILVMRPLSEALSILEGSVTGVLTPHVLEPLPRDGAIPDDLMLLKSGIYNLGFLGLTATDAAKEFLSWWDSWLQDHCFEDTTTGTFTDQKWVNFAPVFWPAFKILRNPTYNVAYWNLSQRKLTLEKSSGGEAWLVDGEPLTFFHFSGFNPDHPQVLSKHQNRITVSPWSPLAALLKRYAALVKGNGYEYWRRVGFVGVRFVNGVAMDDICRSLYRDALRDGVRFADLLGVGSKSFYAWLREPVGGAKPGEGPLPLITRYMHKVYVMRPDVMRAYPDLFGANADGFVHWLFNSGIKEMALNPEFLPKEKDISSSVVERQGVNYIGYMRSDLGLGEAARGNVQALEQASANVDLYDISHLSISPRNDWRLSNQAERKDERHSINVIHVNADELPRVREHLAPPFFEDRYNIGVWAWESPHFPKQWWDRFQFLDEIWVGGTFMAESIAQVSPVPVVHIPHVVEVPDVKPDRKSFGFTNDEFLLLFMFDFHSSATRKNPEGAIEAFRRAFSADEPVRLIIKSLNGHHRPYEFNAMKKRAAGLRVSFIDQSLDSRRRYQLLASCDVFLSLHRAEGFGLGLAEAMAYGKPVVATGWSGNMDFMHVGNSFPVNFALKPLETSDPPYEAGTLWAEPDIDHAAALLRKIWTDPEQARRVAARGREDIARQFSAERIGVLMRERLARVQDIRRMRSMAHVSDQPAAVAARPSETRQEGREARLVTPYQVQQASEHWRRHLVRKSWKVIFERSPPRIRPLLVRYGTAMKRRMGYV